MTALILGTFVTFASQRFSAWSDEDYCARAHAAVDQQAADICQPYAAEKSGDYVDNFRGVTCTTHATYSCATELPPQVEPK